jgi:glycosyltransferase involved in cell wall biosynthesis
MITMGVNARRFRVRPKGEARRAAGVDPGARLIMFVGGATHEKGFDVLDRALARLPGTACVAAGGGPLASPRIQQLGPLGPDSVALWMAASDLVCLPSLAEGTPISIMEALASGRPVVATNVGGIQDLIHQGSNGLLVAPGDDLELADALEQVLGQTWPEQAIRASSERFWWSNVGPRIAQLYSDLLPVPAI